MYLRINYLFILGVLFQFQLLIAQEKCDKAVVLKLTDQYHEEVLSFFTVESKSLQQAKQVDSVGVVQFNGICLGKQQFIVFHPEMEEAYPFEITINHDTLINLNISSFFHHIEEVHLVAKEIIKAEIWSLQKQTISSEELTKLQAGSLGDIVKNLPGVNTVQTGPAIAKPMIHGMYGNRIAIYSQGVRLEGQSWGSEHAPEIDSYAANSISVVKGSASIRYGSDAIGGVILLEPEKFDLNKKLKGQFTSNFFSNGRGGVLSTRLEGTNDAFSWRVQGTEKFVGSYKTPDYFLTNTGNREHNWSSLIQTQLKGGKVSGSYAFFDSKIGIYSGAYVNSLTDLQQIIAAGKPFVSSRFSYQINRGYQTVQHHLATIKLEHTIKKVGKLQLQYAFQSNQRKEYGQSISYNQKLVEQNLPDADFKLNTHTIDIGVEHKKILGFTGAIGLNYQTQLNYFKGLDYRALLPNYSAQNYGVYWMEKITFGSWLFEAGYRFEQRDLLAAMKNSITKATEFLIKNWTNSTVSLGGTYAINSHQKLFFNWGMGWRPPSAIELYASGVHQSAASYEIGDKNLNKEQSNNFQLDYSGSYKKWNWNLGTYALLFSNYIYLNPLKQPITTIAGTYPGFEYKQGKVKYKGVDASIHYWISSKYEIKTTATFINAFNQTLHDYLIYVPANQFTAAFEYKPFKRLKWADTYVELATKYVLKQRKVPAFSDYMPAPNAYQLVDFHLGTKITHRKITYRVQFSVTNLFNVKYRDYLNRLRYFSDELGRNFILRFTLDF